MMLGLRSLSPTRLIDPCPVVLYSTSQTPARPKSRISLGRINAYPSRPEPRPECDTA